MALSAAAEAELRKAQPSSVVQAFGNLRRYLRHDRWLGVRNSYLNDTVGVIDAHLAATPSAINQKHLVEYIAASVPLHAVDGWSYLGRALSAHLLGDTYAARHLAYYAELRAAMSILATQGVGVFNRKHFVVTSPVAALRVPGKHSTHQFTWDALKWWAGTPTAATTLGNTISAYQQSISSWLGGAPGYGSWAPQAQDWILKLGLDLDHAANDQRSRNEASYRPTRIRPLNGVDVRVGAEFAIALWLTLEPTPAGFERLDQHFLRRSFEEAYTSVTSRSPSSTSAHFASAVDALLIGNGVAEPRLSFLTGFLRRQTDADDLVLTRNAAIDSKSTAIDHHLHVMSRATLLLAIASKAARSTVQDATIGSTDTQFWWELLGADRGLWSDDQVPPDPLDFWGDVQVELDDVRVWLDSGGDQRSSLITECPRSVARLSQLEVVGLWGIAA